MSGQTDLELTGSLSSVLSDALLMLEDDKDGKSVFFGQGTVCAQMDYRDMTRETSKDSVRFQSTQILYDLMKCNIQIKIIQEYKTIFLSLKAFYLI